MTINPLVKNILNIGSNRLLLLSYQIAALLPKYYPVGIKKHQFQLFYQNKIPMGFKNNLVEIKYVRPA